MKGDERVVESFKRKEFILPIVMGICLGLLYFKLPLSIFTFIFLGFIIMIATLYSIKIGICLSVFLMPYLPFTVDLLFMIFVFFAYIYKGIFRKIDPFTKETIDIPIVLFVIAIIISTITSIDPKGSLRDLVFQLVSISFVFVVINNIKSKKDLNTLLTILVITATISSLYGIYQYITGLKMTDRWVDEAGNPGIVTRVFSVFDNPNVLAEYLIMTIPISIALLWNSKKACKKIIFLFTTIILVTGLGLTYSRGGWLGFAFGIFIFILFTEKRLLFILLPLGLLVLPFLPATILNRILSIKDIADSSTSSRFGIWLTAINIIKDNWMAGIGLGSNPFRNAYRHYVRSSFVYYHAHNTYLQTAVEMGVAGLIVLFMLIFIIYKYSIKDLIKGKDRWVKIVTAGILSGLSAIFIHSFFDSIFFMPKTIITFWTLISFLLVLLRLSNSSNEII